MNQFKRSTPFLVILVVVLTGLSAAANFEPSFAQDAAPSATPLGSSVAAQPVLFDSTATGEAQRITLSLADLGYSNTSLNDSSAAVFKFDLPGHWQPLPGSTFILNYTSNSGLENEIDRPRIQIIMNDITIYEAILLSGGPQSLTIPLPDKWPERRGTDRLAIISHVGDCERNSSSFITIHSDSFLDLQFQAAPPVVDLESFPAPMYEPTFLSYSALMVLPDDPSTQVLEAGLALAAGLGNRTDNGLQITTSSSARTDVSMRNENLLLIGKPENNPALLAMIEDSNSPAQLKQRQLALETNGPDSIPLESESTFTIQVSNDEVSKSGDLTLNSRLPLSAEEVSCDPTCEIQNNLIGWQIGPLEPNETKIVSVTFKLPHTVASETVDVTSELAVGQEPINVSTLQSSIAPATTPNSIQATAVSDYFFIWNGQAIAETDGIIQFVPSPWQPGKSVLIITGLTDEGVIKAGRALGSDTHYLGMTGQAAVIDDVRQQSQHSLETTDSLTLSDLGYEEQNISGVGPWRVQYRFPLPPDWALTPEAKVTLRFSHSALLNPISSSFTVFLNSTPIASAALDDDNSANGTLELLLPPQYALAGQMNSLVLQGELSLPDPCGDNTTEHAWLNLHSSSSLELPHILTEASPQLDLDLLPLPFVADPSLTNVLIALPAQPTHEEYTAAMQIISSLGGNSNGGSFYPSISLGIPSEEELAANHMILIGRPRRNPMIQLVNNALPQPFVPHTDIIQQTIDDTIFRLPNDIDLGFLQLIPSIWNSQNALLIATGTSDLGVSWSTQTVVDSAQLGRLSGDLAILREQESFSIDTRILTNAGSAVLMSTAIPETEPVSDATPSPDQPMDTTMANASDAGADYLPSSNQSLPDWVLTLVGAGILLIIVVLVIAYGQSRRRK